MMVTIAYRKRVKMSRMRGWHQTEQAQEFRMLAEFAYHTSIQSSSRAIRVTIFKVATLPIEVPAQRLEAAY